MTGTLFLVLSDPSSQDHHHGYIYIYIHRNLTSPNCIIAVIINLIMFSLFIPINIIIYLDSLEFCCFI